MALYVSHTVSIQQYNTTLNRTCDKADSPLIDQVRGGMAGMGSGYLYPTMSAPQTNLENRRFPVMAGNLVGGSSAVNAMMTVRGTSEDYDRWGSFFGEGSSWSWEGLLPYFKKVTMLAEP